MIHPEKMYAFSLFLSFLLNPTAAKEETMPFVNTDGTTLLLKTDLWLSGVDTICLL